MEHLLGNYRLDYRKLVLLEGTIKIGSLSIWVTNDTETKTTASKLDSNNPKMLKYG